MKWEHELKGYKKVLKSSATLGVSPGESMVAGSLQLQCQ